MLKFFLTMPAVLFWLATVTMGYIAIFSQSEMMVEGAFFSGIIAVALSMLAGFALTEL